MRSVRCTPCSVLVEMVPATHRWTQLKAKFSLQLEPSGSCSFLRFFHRRSCFSLVGGSSLKLLQWSQLGFFFFFRDFDGEQRSSKSPTQRHRPPSPHPSIKQHICCGCCTLLCCESCVVPEWCVQNAIWWPGFSWWYHFQAAAPPFLTAPVGID